MPTITPIQPEQVEEARRVIYTTAHALFHDYPTVEETIAHYSESWPMHDMDDGCRHYFEQEGIFLVMQDEAAAQPRIIGTGALRRLDDGVCELKRLWFLPAYHGQGLGYQMMICLLAFAREKGYHFMRLCTDPESQPRAAAFYRRLGFYEIPCYKPEDDNFSMELVL